MSIAKMNKLFNEMNTLAPYNPSWLSDFRMESIAISSALGDIAATIHHIGSTSIPGMRAKPIIDILVEIYSIESVDTKTSEMVNIGYEPILAFRDYLMAHPLKAQEYSTLKRALATDHMDRIYIWTVKIRS